MVTFYYAITDENGVLCVDRLGDNHHFDRQATTEDDAANLAVQYPDVIYFYVDPTTEAKEFTLDTDGPAVTVSVINRQVYVGDGIGGVFEIDGDHFASVAKEVIRHLER